jgi:aspartate racemase
MKTLGILGGLSPESTIYYYQYIIHRYHEQFGDHGYPKIIIYSATFQEYVDWGMSGNWDAITDDMVSALNALSDAGADFGIIATNTLHYVFDKVMSRVELPVISLVDAVCEYANGLGINKLALLGTKLTMKKDFYHKALANFGIKTLIPEPEDMKTVHDVIFTELAGGIINPESKRKYLDIIAKLAGLGAQGVILGCTEIPLLIKPEDVDIHVLDSSLIHAEAALKTALE